MDLNKNPDKIKDPDDKKVWPRDHVPRYDGPIQEGSLHIPANIDTLLDNSVGDIHEIQTGWQSELRMPGDLAFQLPKPRPNWWWRLWQYLFFGFKWKDLTK